jgi:hypothetical protein
VGDGLGTSGVVVATSILTLPHPLGRVVSLTDLTSLIELVSSQIPCLPASTRYRANRQGCVFTSGDLFEANNFQSWP